MPKNAVSQSQSESLDRLVIPLENDRSLNKTNGENHWDLIDKKGHLVRNLNSYESAFVDAAFKAGKEHSLSLKADTEKTSETQIKNLAEDSLPNKDTEEHQTMNSVKYNSIIESCSKICDDFAKKHSDNIWTKMALQSCALKIRSLLKEPDQHTKNLELNEHKLRVEIFTEILGSLEEPIGKRFDGGLVYRDSTDLRLLIKEKRDVSVSEIEELNFKENLNKRIILADPNHTKSTPPKETQVKEKVVRSRDVLAMAKLFQSGHLTPNILKGWENVVECYEVDAVISNKT